jgi:RNA polymerase sigma factor (sigma-70 family)
VPEESVAEQEPVLEQREAVQALLAALSPRQRTVLVLRYQEDWSEREIAAALGVSPGTMKTPASRALARLRTTVRPEERTDA